MALSRNIFCRTIKLIYYYFKVVNMRQVPAFATDYGASPSAIDAYRQQEQPRGQPVIPQWATDQVGKYTGYGAAAGFSALGAYSLFEGLGIAATAANILGGAVGLGLIFGIARFGYNLLKRYKFL